MCKVCKIPPCSVQVYIFYLHIYLSHIGGIRLLFYQGPYSVYSAACALNKRISGCILDKFSNLTGCIACCFFSEKRLNEFWTKNYQPKKHKTLIEKHETFIEKYNAQIKESM